MARRVEKMVPRDHFGLFFVDETTLSLDPSLSAWWMKIGQQMRISAICPYVKQHRYIFGTHNGHKDIITRTTAETTKKHDLPQPSGRAASEAVSNKTCRSGLG
jgi:hypothetical protein